MWAELIAWFSDDAACRTYLEGLRWPEGFRCPACGGDRGWRSSDERWKYAGCARRTPMTAGTIFDKTRTPLTTWLAAAWNATNQKNSASALSLQRVLGVGSYETAWAMLHRLRSAMVRPDRDRVSGDVEVDENYVGGEETGVARRQTQTIVAIAVERHRPRGFGRTPLRHVADCSADSLMPFVRNPVKAGSTVCTDDWKAYEGLPQAGYQRYRQVLASSPDPAHVSMPGVHCVASLLKRWLLGTHQGSVGPAHLQAYFDEFTFRFNRRNSRQRGLLFYRLLEQAVTAPRSPSMSSPRTSPDAHNM